MKLTANDIRITAYTTPDEELLTQLVLLEQQVFEKPLEARVLRAELSGRSGLIILLAHHKEVICGYKVGYRLSATDTYFYSWIGGVLPAYRNQGIALELMKRQHTLALESGCAYVRTKTKNKYKAMLILNLKYGFNVCGVYHKLNEEDPGIILEKKL